MPRKKSNSLNNGRQALAKGAQRALKAARKNAQRAAKQAQAKRDQDLLMKWRALVKGGVIATKNKPSKKALTPSIKRKVARAYRQLQDIGHYEMGRVHHPLKKETYKTKSGKTRQRYTFTEFFKPIKTKQKVQENASVTKTAKGYIVEHNAQSKVTIRNGQVYTKENGIVWRQRIYKGDEVFELYRQIKENEIKLSDRNMIVWNPFGGSVSREVTYNEGFIQMLDEYATQMTHTTFQAFMDKTPFMFGIWK